LRPMYQAGKNSLASMLLPCLGGIEIISREISPASTASSLRAMCRRCAASL